MSSVADQLETIGMMAAHESAIADLYEAYAGKFPQQVEFFRSLAAEEREHARSIVGFAEKVRTREARVNPDRFSSLEILTSLDNVHQQLREAERRRDIPLVEILSACADLEDSLLERRYFEILEGDGPELRQLLETLAGETEAHRDKVRQALAKQQQEEP